MFFLLIGLIALSEACSIAKKTNCTIAMIDCEFICEFSIMNPKYHDECMGCIMTTVKRCCKCLFPNSNYNITSISRENIHYVDETNNIKSIVCTKTYCTFQINNNKK